MIRLFKRITILSALLAILYASYLLLLLSIPYLDFKSNTAFLVTKQLVYHVKIWRFSFYLHVFSSIFCITAGLLQFIPFILQRFKSIHRASGYLYVLVVLGLSGPSGLVMSFYANGGVLAKTSFVLLSTSWLWCTYVAVYKVKRRDFYAHGVWMVRSYALTLSAVSLRFYAYIMDFLSLNLSPTEEYTLLAWISWIPNLLLAELLIRKGFVAWVFGRNQKNYNPKT